MFELPHSMNDTALSISKACFQDANKHREILKRAAKGDQACINLIWRIYQCKVFTLQEKKEYYDKISKKIKERM